MRHRPFTIVSALSLLLFLATAALWARSYRSRLAVPFRYQDERWEIVSNHGRLTADNVPQQVFDRTRRLRAWTNLKRLERAYQAAFISDERGELGAAVDAEHAVDIRDALRREQHRMDQLAATPPPSPAAHSAPHIVLLAATIGLPLWWLASVVRPWHRRIKGRCAMCGYDLRASPTRCPECGAACKAPDPAGASPAAGD